MSVGRCIRRAMDIIMAAKNENIREIVQTLAQDSKRLKKHFKNARSQILEKFFSYLKMKISAQKREILLATLTSCKSCFFHSEVPATRSLTSNMIKN